MSDSFFNRRLIRSFGWEIGGGAGDGTSAAAVTAAHTKGVTALALAHSDTLAVSAGGDNAASLWETATGACLCRFEGHEGWISCLAVPTLAIVRQYDGGQPSSHYDGGGKGAGAAATDVAVVAADLHFVTGAVDGQALLWDARELHSLARGAAAAALLAAGKPSEVNPLVLGVEEEGAANGATRPLAPLEDVPRLSPALKVRHGDSVCHKSKPTLRQLPHSFPRPLIFTMVPLLSAMPSAPACLRHRNANRCSAARSRAAAALFSPPAPAR